jgi:hypothetical protein
MLSRHHCPDCHRMARIPPRLLGKIMVYPPRRSLAPNIAMDTHRCTGQTWATHTITTLWDYVQTTWQLHNDTVHTHDAKTEDIDLKTRTHFRIIRLHQRRNNTMAMHHDYFVDNPTATLTTTTLNFQRNWLNLCEPTILESIKMAEAESIRDTPSLTEYFVTIRPGKTPQPKVDKRHHKTKRRRKHIELLSFDNFEILCDIVIERLVIITRTNSC